MSEDSEKTAKDLNTFSDKKSAKKANSSQRRRTMKVLAKLKNKLDEISRKKEAKQSSHN